ncbi:UNVERIFIED_CONTAM: putative amino-acid acetyltransferase NAGS1, chloroplastic [Sesamum angustifolium]|uniref:Amino-acid acetyltransferase NAGS1, chloroplastic n=1 Tax=Sesamum angustifolium TaxID=2727405 RepID=A0AAW2NLR0_9LAMI
MAAASPRPCIPVQNYGRRRESNLSSSSVTRPRIDFGGMQLVKMPSFEVKNGYGKKINVFGETGNVAIEVSSAMKDEFVRFFREAWPYFLAHRGSTFVVVISAEISDSPHLDPILMARFCFHCFSCSAELFDISLLHGLGVKFVLVPGTHVQIDRLLAERGSEPKYVGSHRITDSDSLSAAMDASGSIGFMIEAKLSPGPSLSGIRRHGGNGRRYDGVNVASGNFVAAKRRGVVDGIDYASTGEVKRLMFLAFVRGLLKTA